MINIPIEDLKIHPKNVRTQYEGIEELAASIKKKGVLQNLTVVPDPEEEDKYLVVIGNRRLTAARAAGVKELPCVIDFDMSESEQVATMLCENMNRKDLKVYEEAAAMQMCIEDYGFSVEDVAQKTGLSKTTVNHRLNIARLDREELIDKAEDLEFQLTLHDLLTLEKVKSEKTRNKILREARDSKDLARMAEWEATEERKKANELAFKALAKKRGIKKAPPEAENNYYAEWEKVTGWDLRDKVPSRLVIPKDDRELFCMTRYGEFLIIAKKSKKKRDLAEWEIKEKERQTTQKKIREKYRALIQDMGDFIRFLFKDVNPPKDSESQFIKRLWHLMLEHYTSYVPKWAIAEVILGKSIYSKNIDGDMRKELFKQVDALPMVYQLMAVAFSQVKDLAMTRHDLEYKDEDGERLKEFKDILSDYGSYEYPNDDLAQIADGTHELYKKKDKEGDA